MNIEEHIERIAEQVFVGISSQELRSAAERLSTQYRRGDSGERQGYQSKLAQAAYIATRMPATFAAIKEVLEELLSLLPSSTIHSVLDIGAGPATATLASLSLFPDIRYATLIEQDSHIAAFGMQFLAKIPLETRWIQGPIEHSKFPPAHLVLMSYVLGEMSVPQRRQMISQALLATPEFLVAIEPGTPRGYSHILELRSQLIEQGFSIIAPCPHNEACPLQQDKNTWCHFSARLSRMKIHRMAKQASLPFEDEKYSYLIASRCPAPSYESRVIGHPQKHTGHIRFDLCTSKGAREQRVISKRQGNFYGEAKKIRWGERFEE